MLRIKLLTAAAATALMVAPAALAQTAPAAPATPAPAQAAPAAAAQTPASAENVIEVLKMHGRFSTLLQALDQAQLTETLATRPRITLFAPTDEVFAALPEGERTRLLDPANAQELRNLLLFHVLVADLTPEQIQGAAGPIATAGGVEVHIDGTGEAITVADATVTEATINASNGGIYVIDKLLDPNTTAQGDTAEAAAPATAEGTTDVNAPNGEPAAAVTTTASPPVENPTDGQVDQTEDAANPAPTPN